MLNFGGVRFFLQESVDFSLNLKVVCVLRHRLANLPGCQLRPQVERNQLATHVICRL